MHVLHPSEVSGSLVCICQRPVPERIPFFDAVQCSVCKKAMTKR
jgi:hypothetical protein